VWNVVGTVLTVWNVFGTVLTVWNVLFFILCQNSSKNIPHCQNSSKNIPHCQNSSKTFHTVRTVPKHNPIEWKCNFTSLKKYRNCYFLVLSSKSSSVFNLFRYF
jgi:hypothetical protein